MSKSEKGHCVLFHFLKLTVGDEYGEMEYADVGDATIGGNG